MADLNLVFNYRIESEYSRIINPFEIDAAYGNTKLQKELQGRRRDGWRLVTAVPMGGVVHFTLLLFWERLSAVEEAR